MNRAKLNGKLMELKLKHGWTANDFVKHLNLESEEDFFIILQKSFTQKTYRCMIRKLNKNSKAKGRQKIYSHGKSNQEEIKF